MEGRLSKEYLNGIYIALQTLGKNLFFCMNGFSYLFLCLLPFALPLSSLTLHSIQPI